MAIKILHQTSWAKSAAGKDIELFCSDSQHQLPILFIGGVHGDEPEGVRLAQDLLAWLQKSHRQEGGENIVPWILIPCLNLDGYLSQQRTNSHGVDLNRNFPSQDWIHECKAPRYFPGPAPASEPEVRALIQLITEKKPHLIVHFHSWEACVVYTGPSGREAAELVGRDTGYRVAEDIGYPTPGSLGQYGWLEKKIPVICIETQEGCDLDSIWPIFGAGLQRLLRVPTRG